MRLHQCIAAVAFSLLVACGGKEDDNAGKDTHPDRNIAQDATAEIGMGQDAQQQETGGDTGWQPDLPPGQVNYLVITAGDLLDTAEAFADYRTQVGYTALVVTVQQIMQGTLVTGDPVVVPKIAAFVTSYFEAYPPDQPFFLLLVGDADSGNNDPAKTVPSGHWGGGWQGCYSDNFYADMDGDHVPDLAVGRIPVRTNDDGLRILDKVKKHEGTYVVGDWNRRLHVYAGEGGFGDDIDLAIETVAQEGLEGVPAEYDMKFAYNSPGSTYYYAPFQDKVLDLVTEGALLVTFMGHGGGELNVPASLAEVVPQHRQPMYAFFACATGDYIGDYDSDTEVVLKQEGGPIAILASQETTHPYGNAINALEMGEAVFVDMPKTFGEAVMRMKWRSLYNDSEIRQILDTFAALYMPESEIEDVPLDHMYSYNLLGDPATEIRFPAGNATVVANDVAKGDTLPVSGTVDNLTTGTAHIEVVCERAAIIHPLTSIDNPQDQDNWPTVQDNWAKANDHILASADAPIVNGAFSADVEIPAKAPGGTYFVTVYAEDGSTDAVGSTAIKVKKGENTDPPGTKTTDWGVVTDSCGELTGELDSQDPSFLTNTYTFDPADAFNTTLLFEGALTRYNSENAGGSSLCSEVMSLQVLHECEGADLYKMETEVTYDVEGKITDYIALIDGDKVGVSVTRAYKGPSNTDYTAQDATDLLEKKLAGINESTQNVSAEDAWVKQVLHIWTLQPDWVDVLEGAYSDLAAELKADTIVLVTVEVNSDYIVTDTCKP